MAALRLLREAAALREILKNLSVVAARDIVAVAGQLEGAGISKQELAEVLVEAFPALMQKYVYGAGDVAAQWYEDLVPDSDYRASVPDVVVPDVRLEKSAKWAVFGPGDAPVADRLVGVAQRAISDAADSTVIANARTEGVRYARIAQADACEFCRILALRGAVYHSEEKAARGHTVDAKHDHCYCRIVPVRPGLSYKAPDYYAEFDEQYKAATRLLPPASSYKGKGKNAYLKDVLAKIREMEAAKPVDIVASAGEILRKEIAAETNPWKILDAAKKAHPKLNWDGDHIGISAKAVQHVRSSVLAVDDFLAKFPDIKLDEVTFKRPEHPEFVTAYAVTYPHSMQDPKSGCKQVVMNTMYEDTMVSSFAKDVREGFHPPTGDKDGSYATMMHELGHVLNWNTKTSKSADAVMMEALQSYFIQTRKIDATQTGYLDFTKWCEANMSGYSYNGKVDAIMVGKSIVPHEAVAEAFADFEINGDAARETSKVIHQVLVDCHNGVEFDPKRKWTDWRPARDPKPINYLEKFLNPPKKRKRKNA